MFENLSDRLERSFKILKGEGKITEINVAETLKDVRRALLDADVNYKVAKTFTDTVKQKALGMNVLTAVKPGQLMVKIVHDELAELMGGEAVGLNLSGRPSIILMSGLQGSGKTTLTALVVRSLIRKKTYTIWIDPESKNEKLTQMYGGTFVDWGKRGNVINVFDLKPIDVDEGEDDSLMWDTALAIDKVIQDVTILFQFLFPQIEEDAISFIGGIVKMAYEEVGIKPDDNGKYQSFKGYTREQYPTFETFNACLLKVRDAMHNKGDGYQDDVKLLNSLSRKMFRILNEWSVYLNGHTTINVNPNGRNIVSFGTKELFNAPQELKNALYYLMFNYSWTLCLNDKIESAFIVDEAHDVIQTSHTAKMVAQFVRRSRKYRNLMFIITQEPEDFAADNVIMHTRAMFNNSAYKIIMKLNKDATEGLEKLQDINENETFWVKNGFQQGDALLILGDRRIPIHVIATQNELWEMGAMLSSGKSN